MRRLSLDLVAFLLIVASGIVVNALSTSDAAELNFVSRFENLVWVAIVSLVAVARIKAEASWYKISGSTILCVLEWCTVAAAGNLALLWLDVLVQPRDNFKTVFAFTFLIFFLPSILVSTIVYSLLLIVFNSKKP